MNPSSSCKNDVIELIVLFIQIQCSPGPVRTINSYFNFRTLYDTKEATTLFSNQLLVVKNTYSEQEILSVLKDISDNKDLQIPSALIHKICLLLRIEISKEDETKRICDSKPSEDIVIPASRRTRLVFVKQNAGILAISLLGGAALSISSFFTVPMLLESAFVILGSSSLVGNSSCLLFCRQLLRMLAVPSLTPFAWSPNCVGGFGVLGALTAGYKASRLIRNIDSIKLKYVIRHNHSSSEDRSDMNGINIVRGSFSKPNESLLIVVENTANPEVITDTWGIYDYDLSSHKSLDSWNSVSKSVSSAWENVVAKMDICCLEWINPSNLKFLKDPYVKELKASLYSSLMNYALSWIGIPYVVDVFYIPKYVFTKICEIDDSWKVCINQADEAGKLLAIDLWSRIKASHPSKNTLTSSSPPSSLATSTATTTATTTTATTTTIIGEDTEIKTAIPPQNHNASSPSWCHFENTKDSISADWSEISRSQFPKHLRFCGYGLGARVIYQCLLHLYELQQSELLEIKKQGSTSAEDEIDLRTIIDEVVLLGTPVPVNLASWAKIRSIVGGRLINGYSTRDRLLATLFRYKSYNVWICGLQEIVLPENTTCSSQLILEIASSASKNQNTVNKKDSNPNNDNNIDTDTDIDDEFYLVDTLDLYPCTVENIDCSNLVTSMEQYPSHMKTIIQRLHL